MRRTLPPPLLAGTWLLAMHVSPLTACAQEQRGQVVSHQIGYYETLRSDILQEDRRILVSLPEDYSTSSREYPVLYLLDGEDLDRFTRSVAGLTFFSGARRLPSVIVVGVLNTDRDRDLAPREIRQRGSSGHADAFLEFLVCELKSHIDREYRSAPYEVLFGGSMAGTFAIYALFSRPESFDAFIASRPALNSLEDITWDSDVVAREAESTLSGASSFRKTLYIDHGGQEDAFHDPGPIRRLGAVIEEHAPPDFRWQVRAMSESRYRSAESLVDGLFFVFDGWHYAADSIFRHGLEGIESHARRLSERLGYSVSVADLLSEENLLMFGDLFVESGDLPRAIALLEYGASAYRDAWEVHLDLADAYSRAGEEESAVRSYQRVLELDPGNTVARRALARLRR